MILIRMAYVFFWMFFFEKDQHLNAAEFTMKNVVIIHLSNVSDIPLKKGHTYLNKPADESCRFV